MAISSIIDNNIDQDILDYSAILETTVKDIHSFLGEVTRIYSGIGEKFPLIEQEMKNENQKANDLLLYFTSKNKGEKTFYNDLEENQEDFFRSFDRMQGFINQDNELSSSLVEDVGKANNIIESIYQIRMLADQIKVYSLNAIIVSSKYGADGKAFGEISKNIIKMSETSNDQADEMTRIGKELFVSFEAFKKDILEVNELQMNNFTIMKEQLDREYNNMVNSFSVFSNIISNIISRVDGTYDFIFEIMMVLPREDIVRQQTEHVIESINSIVSENRNFIASYDREITDSESLDKKENEVSDHKLLDLLTFNDVVLSLVIENFKSIHKEIDAINSDIYKNLKGLKDALYDIASDRDTIVEYMIGGENGKSEFPFTVAESLFNEYMGFIKLYSENFKLFLTNKYRISDSNTSIIDSIEELESMFLETKNIAKIFNSINFLAKIELEKNSRIFSDSKIFSIESIESIALNITETVDSCLEQFHNIKSAIFNSINKFKSNINHQSMEHGFIEDMAYTVSKRLNESKSIINNNIKRLESYAEELFELIDKTLQDLTSLSTLLIKVNEIIDIFNNIRDVVRNKKNECYKLLGIDNWKIEGGKYLDILNSYTIKEERAIANSILSGEDAPDVDINIDEGADSGDFTLF